jgi:hypothetical protein
MDRQRLLVEQGTGLGGRPACDRRRGQRRCAQRKEITSLHHASPLVIPVPPASKGRYSGHCNLNEAGVSAAQNWRN